MAKAKGLGSPPDCSYIENDWKVLAGFWYPVAFESEVGREPFPLTLLDTELVLYRTGETDIVAALDQCPHRGTKLSLGRVEEGELVCAYHGFRYGADGRCTRIPSIKSRGKTKPPARLCLSTFPVQRRYGLVWVCLRPEPRFPIFDWPSLEDPALQRAKVDLFLDSSAGRHFENFCDVSHFSFIHATSFGQVEKPDVPPYKVKDTKYGLYYEMLTHQQDGSLFFGEPDYADLMTEYYVTYPFSVLARFFFPRGVEDIFETVCPISATTCRVFMVKTRDHDLDQPVDDWIAFQAAVNEEDRRIVESQRPVRLPLNIPDEFHVAADAFSGAYRRKWRKLGLTDDFL
jgi:phenylpropionate dioxygenase-like ring-hydroxylating dioxygenase large terminal subunit